MNDKMTHAAGIRLIESLGLRVQPDGRVYTGYGYKTPKELARAASRLLREAEFEAQKTA